MTIVPAKDEDLKQIFQYIMDELGFNIFKDSTRQFFVEQVQELASRGAQGVILGCTEIELLIQQEHVPEVPLFPSAELHIEVNSSIAVKNVATPCYSLAVTTGGCTSPSRGKKDNRLRARCRHALSGRCSESEGPSPRFWDIEDGGISNPPGHFPDEAP